MLSFRVIGIHKETGKDIDFTVEAITPGNAKAKAEMQGILVTSVAQYEDYVPGQAIGYRDAAYSSAAGGASISGITTPLLISAISNIVIGLFWFTLCFGAIFTIPMIVLCVYELSLHSKAAQLPPEELARRAKTIALFEIIVGLLNFPTLICGIVLMIQAGKISR